MNGIVDLLVNLCGDLQVVYVQCGTMANGRGSRGVPTSRGGFYITKWLPDHNYGLNWPVKKTDKITPKMAHSALPGDRTGVTLVTNHYIFIK